MSTRETVLAALYAEIAPIAMLPATALPVTVLRNSALPTKIPAGGLAILFDGDPGEPEQTFSPLTYHYAHRADLVVAVQLADDGDATFDALCGALNTALTADRTLGGLCDWIEPMAPIAEELPLEGAATIKAARVPILLHYATTSPLG